MSVGRAVGESLRRRRTGRADARRPRARWPRSRWPQARRPHPCWPHPCWPHRCRPHARRGDDCGPRDAGAAIVEFVLVSVLLLMLLFGVLQVGAIFYVRNIVAASAADGARYSAAADVDTAEGASRASDLIRRGLSDAAARDISCQAAQVADGDSGLQLTRVECRGRIRSLFVPVGRFISIDIVGRAVKEGQ